MEIHLDILFRLKAGRVRATPELTLTFLETVILHLTWLIDQRGERDSLSKSRPLDI